MTLEIRNATVDDLRDAVEVVSTAFLDRPDLDRLAASVRETWDLRRAWLALDGGRTCGVWRAWETELTVPGGARLPAAAVGPITVLPTHRRRGAFRDMTVAAHEGLRELGDVFSLLHAAEWEIYGRYGYGPAHRRTDWTIATTAAGRVHGTAAGTVELVSARDAMGELKTVFEAWRTRQPGEIRRRDLTWEFNLGLKTVPWTGEPWKGWVVLHRSADGTPDAYARYTAKNKEHGLLPAGAVEVDELIALDDASHGDLLRYLLGIDLVREVVLHGRPETDRTRWLLGNPRAATVTDLGDGIWVRLLDIGRALAARHYEHEGKLTLEVIDAEAPGGRARVLLDATGDGATATPTQATPDLTVPVSALGAAYLGGTRLRDITIASGADVHTRGALELADALLRTAEEPVSSTFF